MKPDDIVWKDVDFEPRIQVSNTGLVRTRATGKIRSPDKDKDGYLIVRVLRGGKRTKHRVNRLVAICFIGAAPEGKIHAAHRNGNKEDNCDSNLYWATGKENCADKKGHGTQFRGSTHPASILTEALVLEVRAAYAEGASTKQLAPVMRCSYRNAQLVLTRQSWTHV